jgi:hypothetical protein
MEPQKERCKSCTAQDSLGTCTCHTQGQDAQMKNKNKFLMPRTARELQQITHMLVSFYFCQNCQTAFGCNEKNHTH